MQIFLAIWREFKRQKANIFFCAFFPAILVFILGTLLEQWNRADYDIPAMEVSFVTDEAYPSFEAFLKEAEAEGLLTLTWKEGREEAVERIDKGLTAVIEYDSANHRIILHQGADGVANRALHIMLESYASMEKAVICCYQNGVPVDSAKLGAAQEFVVAKKLGVERSMMDYYAVCMLVMIIFMGGTSSGMAFYDYRQLGLLDRIAITPVSKVKVFFMMLLGNLPVIGIQIGAIMLCSTFLFGAHYAVGFWANLALILFFVIVALMVNAFGAVMGLAVKVNPTVIMMPLSWILLFFGGSFAKDVFMEGISDRMPTYIIQQAAFDLTLFGHYERVVRIGGAALFFCCLFIGLGTFLFCRKRKG